MKHGTFANGWDRGLLDLRQTMRTPKESLSLLLNPASFILLASFQDGNAGGVPTAHLMLAGSIGAMLALNCLTTLPQVLVTDREDGTLLRLRGTPGATGPYLIAKTMNLMVTAVLTTLLLMVGGLLFLDAPLPTTGVQWLTLTWVLLLGIAAIAPIGAAIGAVLPNPREALALVMLPVFGLVSISGIFVPVSSMPTVLQVIARIFPISWINEGVRAALLPPGAAAGAGHNWEQLQTLGVLAGWTVVGFLLAPALLKKMARRQSGSRLAERKELAVQRGY